MMLRAGKAMSCCVGAAHKLIGLRIGFYKSTKRAKNLETSLAQTCFSKTFLAKDIKHKEHIIKTCAYIY